IEEKDFELGKFYLLRKALDILPRNLEEWLERIKLPESQLGSWREVPLGIQRSIVELAAKELKKKIYMLLRDDFKKHFAFLDGKTLSGLVKSYSSILVFRRNLDLIPHTLNEWFDMIGQVYVTWAEVPRDIQWELIQKAASELGKEVLKVSSHDLIHHHFSFINNKTLSGIYEYYNSDIEALRRLLILPMLMKEVPLTNIIEPKNMLEWLAHFKENGISVEGWETVPMPVQRRFVQILAEHLNKSPAELTKNDFWVPIPLFGPEGTNGRALITLYYFYEDVRILLETLGFV
ncbi:MAG: hypothetical protein NC821_03095, partial [Candidatus Omnitrophica bacterium]|nr:hypothetical protein [Candidatus Omnitrophota bacterium]